MNKKKNNNKLHSLHIYIQRVRKCVEEEKYNNNELMKKNQRV